MLLLGIYVLSIVISYFIFRVYYKIDKYAWANPHWMTISIMFMPAVNIIFPLILLLQELTLKNNFEFNYKKFFLLRKK